MLAEAKRIQQLPPYLFARIEEKISAAKAQGVDVISLGIGDPDRPTPNNVIEELIKQSKVSTNHQYPTSVGLVGYREAVAKHYKERFNVDLDAKTEVVALLGSKDGIAHISWCYVDPGDINLIPDPGYPVYGISTILAGGEAYPMPLKEDKGYLPDFEAIPTEVAVKAKLMFLNYPNNPTSAVASPEFYETAISFAKKNDIIICHDAAYQDISMDGYKAPSFLEIPGAKDVGIEFGSLSKTYNMTGWRIGWAAGNPRVIEALGRIKSNIDSGVFQAIQYAGIQALTGPQDSVTATSQVYQERRDIIVDGLNSLGWRLEKPKSTIYIWAPTPKGFNSMSFAEHVFEKTGVVITPGNGYGQYGEGYFRISLTIEKERALEAINRLKENLGPLEFKDR